MAASYPHVPNISAPLSNVTFNVLAKLLEYDLPSKVRSDLVSHSDSDTIHVTSSSHCHCTSTTAIKPYHLTQLHIVDGA